MLDKSSNWSYENGLKTMLTTLLQMGIAGYPFVLPDMIGGNGYNGQPSRELYIRWLQANVFMPSLQFSYVPWMYDQEVVNHARDMATLHDSYSATIIQLANEATTNGEPINRPIWWLDPTDQTALATDSGNDNPSLVLSCTPLS
jgi:alpha-glucosidase (family GH31 glycosyl hydrolase)